MDTFPGRAESGSRDERASWSTSNISSWPCVKHHCVSRFRIYLKLATKDLQGLHICLESVNWEFLIFMCSFWCWKQEKFVLLIAKLKSILCSETSIWKAFSGNNVSVPQDSVCRRFWKPIQSERFPLPWARMAHVWAPWLSRKTYKGNNFMLKMT